MTSTPHPTPDRTPSRTASSAVQRPVHQIRLGTLKAAIWAFPTPRNTLRYSVTLQRIYKDKGLWKRSDVYRRDDLLTLAKVLDQAHSWIHAQNHTLDRSTAPRAQSSQEQSKTPPSSNPTRSAESATTARQTTPPAPERAAGHGGASPARAKATRILAPAVQPSAGSAAETPAA